MLAVALSVALQAAGLSAPLVHAHPDEHVTEHHSGRAVHTHWDGHTATHHTSDDPAVRAADHDRAVFFNAFVAVSVSTLPTQAVVPVVGQLPVPAERSAQSTIEITNGHDPPFYRSLSSRAPPTLLS
jgi:hypothetical protein